MEKTITINSFFKRLFGEELLQRQFMYCSKLGVFIRVINEELIQYVGLDNLGLFDKEKKGFRVFSSVLSIYVNQITKENFNMFGITTDSYAEMKCKKKISDVYIYDAKSLEEKMLDALHDFMECAYATLENSKELKKYVSEYKGIGNSQFAGAERWMGDSLSLIRIDDHSDFLDELNVMIDKVSLCPGYASTSRERLYNLYYNGMVQSTAGERDKVYNDPELYAAALKECEIRKERNLQTLRELKVIK